VFLPDLRQFTALVTAMLTFMTPIFYPIEVVPEYIQPIMKLNPFTHLITWYRMIFMNGVLPDGGIFILMVLLTLVVLLFGYFWFIRTKKGFADVL
jgi:lipopolysaccharide transport system permease protein